MASSNPTSSAGTPGYCNVCKVVVHIPTSAVGRRHKGPPVRWSAEKGQGNYKVNKCGGQWVSGVPS